MIFGYIEFSLLGVFGFGTLFIFGVFGLGDLPYFVLCWRDSKSLHQLGLILSFLVGFPQCPCLVINRFVDLSGLWCHRL